MIGLTLKPLCVTADQPHVIRAQLVALLAVLAALLVPAAALADLGDAEYVPGSWGLPASDYDRAGLVLPLASSGDEGQVDDMVRTADGSIYVLLHNSIPEVLKLGPDGALDTGWGEGGRETITDADGAGAWGLDFRGLAVAADGTVYVGGTRVSAFGSARQMAVAQIGPTGQQDMGFGDADHDGTADGIATYQGAAQHNEGADIAIFDGGVVVAGDMRFTRQGGGTETRMAAFAWNADGTPNADFTTFGAPGLALSDSDGIGHSVAVQQTDAGERIVIAGYTTTAKTVDEQTVYDEHFVVARLDADGSPDPSFGTGGHTLSPDLWPGSDARPRDVDVVGDDIYVAGSVANGWGVARFTADGELDGGFGTGGLVRPSFAQAPDVAGGEARAVEVSSGTGQVFVAGTTYPPMGNDAWHTVSISVVRLDADGDVDAIYHGGGGAVREAKRETADHAGEIALLSDDRLLVAGSTVAPYAEDTGYKLRPTVLRLSGERTAPTNEFPPATNFDDGATEGDTVNTSDGVWHTYGGEPTVSYRWERCDTAHGATADVDAALDCDTISGAIAYQIELGRADGDKHVRAVVTVTNDAAKSSRYASATGPVTPLPPESTGQPVVAPAGPVTVGQTIVITDRRFSGGGTLTYTYAWVRCDSTGQESEQCAPIGGATADEYTTVAADAGKFVRAKVSASNSGGESLFPAYSKPVAVNAGGGGSTVVPPTKTADPTIDPAGDVTVGDALTATSLGGFTGSPAPTLSRQWERCGGTAAAPASCDGIPGAQGATYTTTVADAGRVVRLAVYATNGPGTVAKGTSSGRAVKARPAEKKPDPASSPAGGGGAPATGGRPAAAPAPRPVSTQTTVKMPNVLGRTADEAIDAIARAGIYADVKVDAQARRKPLVLGGRKLDPGQVHSQSTGSGTPVASSIGSKHRVRLVVEAGPKGIKACQSADFRRELKGIDLEETWRLLEEKDCDGRVNLNFKVAGRGDDPEVQSATKDGGELRVTVAVPASPAEYDLFPLHSQGAYPDRPMPSFGIDDFALTAGVDNVFGVRVIDRYIGDGTKVTGARSGVGVQVWIDGDGVGAEDVVRRTRADTGNMAIFSAFHPTRAGEVRYLVQAQDAAGNKIFGFSHFDVKRRTAFTSISGESWAVRGGQATRTARAAGGPVARAASVEQMLGWMRQLFAGGPLQALGQVAGSASEGLVTLAKRAAGPVQLAFANVQSSVSQLMTLRPASVVAAGGANVVAAGGANVVAAGGANLIGAAGGNAVAAGGANLFGKETFQSGSGSVRMLPDPQKLLSDNGLGLISDNGLGLRSASKVIAKDQTSTLIGTAAGNIIGSAAGNIIGTAAGNILNHDNANLIGQAGGN